MLLPVDGEGRVERFRSLNVEGDDLVRIPLVVPGQRLIVEEAGDW